MSSKPSKDRKAERAMEEQRKQEELRLAEAESDIAKKKIGAKARLGGRSLLLTNQGGQSGLPSKFSGVS